MNKLNLVVFKRLFHTSLTQNAGKIWRQQNNLPKLQTAGPLIELPDYSFLDGRPTPLNNGQLKRRELQERLGREMVEELKYLKLGKDKVNQEKQKIQQFKNESGQAKLIKKFNESAYTKNKK